MTKTYKPFNLEAAKAGEKVVTRSGCPVRIVSYDRVDSTGYSIVALVNEVGYSESAYVYRETGNYNNTPGRLDLFMAPKKRECWVVTLSLTEEPLSMTYMAYPHHHKVGEAGVIAINRIEWEE